jgi:PPOX class probable F420-dependent enzyme
MTSLDDFARIGLQDRGLAVFATSRSDATIQASLVNAGVLAHPTSGEQVVAIVAAGSSRKLAHLRARPNATVVARSGWEWVAVEGTTELAGPDDELDGLDEGGLRQLLRDVFTAAGGTHDDWDGYDRVMADERRTVVLVVPRRVYSNG